ncbi:hypothetical protein [Mycoplasma leonicaptivi]|uniref:hypothetical protein n=1 Tax=Mycoplasma leonicaptivi TaxID=36742 RepID=UPI00048064FC|nr:hypothetical protein [Mycoplasma leonicaptivi]
MGVNNNDTERLATSTKLTPLVNDSFDFNPSNAPLSKLVDDNKTESGRWDTWGFFGKEQPKPYVTLQIHDYNNNDDHSQGQKETIINTFKLWTRVNGYNRNGQTGKRLPTEYIKLYTSVDGVNFNPVTNQDKVTKKELFGDRLDQNGEVLQNHILNGNYLQVDIKFDPVLAKYIRFEFKAPEIPNTKGTQIQSTNEIATTNLGIVGFTEVEVYKLTDAGKQKWEDANNIETQKPQNDSVTLPENIQVNFKDLNLSNLSFDNTSASKVVEVSEKFDLNTLDVSKINVQKLMDNTPQDIDNNIAVVVEETKSTKLGEKLLSKTFKVTLLKDETTKKVFTFELKHKLVTLRDFRTFMETLEEEYNSLLHGKTTEEKYRPVFTLKQDLDNFKNQTLKMSVNQDFTKYKDQASEKLLKIKDKLAELDNQTLLLFKKYEVNKKSESEVEIKVTIDRRFVKGDENTALTLKTSDANMIDTELSVAKDKWSEGFVNGTPSEKEVTFTIRATNANKEFNIIGLTLGNELLAKFEEQISLTKQADNAGTTDNTAQGDQSGDMSANSSQDGMQPSGQDQGTQGDASTNGSTGSTASGNTSSSDMAANTQGTQAGSTSGQGTTSGSQPAAATPAPQAS